MFEERMVRSPAPVVVPYKWSGISHGKSGKVLVYPRNNIWIPIKTNQRQYTSKKYEKTSIQRHNPSYNCEQSTV